jgi:hypothetical protein
MVYAIKDTLKVIESKVKATGQLKHTQVGEPKGPPANLPAGAIYMDSVRIYRLTVDGGTGEVHTVNLRVYADMLGEPAEWNEYGLAEVAENLINKLLTDADLTGKVMTIDAAGMAGEAVGLRFGYVDVSGKMHRIVDITLPILVNDSIVVAP